MNYLSAISCSTRISTSGPRAFSRLIGTTLPSCETLPVVPFDKIQTDMPIVSLSDLSTDQQYLWEICDAIAMDQCSPSLSSRNPGAISRSRWLPQRPIDSCGCMLRLAHRLKILEL